MTDFWQELLQQQATVSENFDLQSCNYFTPLEDMGVLQVAGDDAESFLQNLLTNDVAALAVNQTQRSGFCNAKGRLFALFLLVRQHDGYQLLLPKNMCDLLQQRLNMYVLRSKVTISNQSDNLFCIGTITTDHAQIGTQKKVKLPNDSNRFISICNHENIQALISQLKQQKVQLAPPNVWEKLDIEAGLPMIWPESKEKFTPQQINLDLIDGVSFSKGCYPGQEVVARLHYLGKPSRRLFIAEAETNQLPDIADEIATIDGTVAGHIVSAQLVGESVKLLISLKLASERASLILNNTTPITIQPSNTVDE